MKENYQLILDNKIKELVDAKITPKLLLHACCAPCSSYVLEYLSKYFKITIYFYNPNMDDSDEYKKRSDEIVKLISSMDTVNKVDYIIEEYDKSDFLLIAKGLEEEVEGGARCTKCYELRLRKTANYAKRYDYDYFTTTLSISPYKNSFKLNEIGMKLESELKVKYLQADFKKRDGYKRSIELSRVYNLYRQDYCGCIYSKRDHLKKVREKKINNLKSNKLLILLVIMLLTSAVMVPTFTRGTNILGINTIKAEDSPVDVNFIYIYGTHLNLEGSLKLENLEFSKVSLYFSGKKSFYSDINYEYVDNKLNFSFADKLNDGFDLENQVIGKYDIYLAIQNNDEIKYYNLVNNTEYDKTTYYTLSNKDQEINFLNNKTLTMVVSKNTHEDYVDIMIDPGHGGDDTGACYKNKCETDYTLDLSNMLMRDLESRGYKVALTRDSNKTLDSYGKGSRTGSPYEANAKFLVSIHLNAGPDYSGYEIYTPYNVNYLFATNLKSNFDKIGANPSPNTFNKVSSGIYTRTLNEGDLVSFREHAKKNDYEMPDANTETNYYYMIRETGGYMTGAYTDGRYKKDGENPYYTSNRGVESYIVELGYITSDVDMEFLNSKTEKYIEQLTSAIDNYLS